MDDLTAFQLAGRIDALLKVLNQVIESTSYELDEGQAELIRHCEEDVCYHLHGE